MHLEKETVRWQSLFAAIVCFIQGSTTVIGSFILPVTKQDSWMMVITGFVAASLLAQMYIRILWRYPGYNLIQINSLVLGPIVGKLVSILYCFYFLSLAALNTRDVSNFVVNNIMPETPIAVVVVMFLLVCAYAVHTGLGNMLRYSFLLMIMGVLVFSINALMLLPEMNFDNLKPMLEFPMEKYLQATHIMAVIPLGEVVAFTMIIPRVEEQGRVPRAISLAIAVGSTVLVFVLLRDIATLGNLSWVMTLPAYESVRLIDLWEVVTRMELFFAIVLVVLQFFKVNVLYYCTVLTIAQTFGLKDYKPITLVTGLVLLNYSLFVFNSISENAGWGATVAPFFSSVFVIVLPILLMAVILLRGLPAASFPKKSPAMKGESQK